MLWDRELVGTLAVARKENGCFAVRDAQFLADCLGGRPGFELAAKVACWHHERWDGGGYPDGLSGGQIPEANRSRFT